MKELEGPPYLMEGELQKWQKEKGKKEENNWKNI